MKKQLAVFNILLLVAGLMIILNCKKKDDPEKPAAPVFSLSSLVVQITGDTIDLNDSIAPVNVPLNPPIIAVFTIDVAPSSVDTNTITLVSMTDNSRVRLSITPASNKIVIMPTSELLNATHYQLRFIGLKSTDNQSLASLVRDFTTIEGPPVFSLSTLLAGTIDLNGATAAANVPVNPTIVARFTLDVNTPGVTSGNITLLREWDHKFIPLTVTTVGATITIVPNEDLGNGALFKLTFPNLTATDGQALPGFFRTFKTLGGFVPTGQIAYWNFDGNTNDQVGSFNADSIIDITYTSSYNAAAGTAASFNGTTSIIEIPNADQLTNTSQFTLCFWVKTNSAGHVDADGNPKGHFVLGLGAFWGFDFEITGSYELCKLGAAFECNLPGTNPHDLIFNGDGIYNNSPQGWKACTYCKLLTPTPAEGMAALIKDQWASVVVVFDGSTKTETMYFNGQRMREEDFDLADPTLNAATGIKWGGVSPDVYPRLAFGFIQSRQGLLWANQPWGDYKFPTSNHFQGQLDDVRIFHRALSAMEVSLIYASEKP